MTRKTRRLIFYIFLFLFVVFALAIILYAQGYGFDWQKKSLVITGAFYFKSNPKKADIYINNKYIGKTSKFIKRLLPKDYDIKISKPDYHEWQKTLGIDSKLVTEAKNILLIKKNPSLNLVIDRKVKYLSFSPDGKKVVYLTDEVIKEIDPTQQKIADPREIPSHSKFTLRLLDLTNNTDRQIYPAPLVKGAGLPNLNNLSKVSWSSDNKKLLLSFPYNYYYVFDLSAQGWSASGGENSLKIIDLNNLIKIASNYQIYSIENSLFHFQDSDKIYFLFSNNLFLMDLTNMNPPLNLASNILTYNLAESKILYIQSTDYYLYEMNLDGSNKQKIVKIPKGVQEIQLSDDNKKLLWRTKNEIGVIWLEPDFEQPSREKYETEIIMKAFKEINQAIWYPEKNQHIIFVVGNDIKITELDSRDKRNTANIYSVEKPVVFFNKWNKKLHLLSEEKFFEIDF